ncbi:ATP-binding protein [Methylobacterium sp. ID0610]|uniref:ATP-binding protein n=1 Tax=Methylobacterium carpenticola TaxID=3344827 RepID=UPI003673D061
MRALLDRYADGMARYVATEAEAALVEIEELGRTAIAENRSLEEIAELHEAAALALAETGVPMGEPAIIRRMSACLSALTISAAVAYRTALDLLARQRLEEHRRSERERQRLESLGTLVGSVAHELNNLLQPVHGLTEIMLADLDARPPERADLEIVLDCAGQAVTVIRSILAYVRRETSPPRRIALGAAVSAACDFLQSMLRQPLAVTIADRTSPVLAAEGELTQILMNLVRNAMQAEAARITVRVEGWERPWIAPGRAGGDPPMPCLRLSVTDDGRGMPPEVAARAADPFFTTKPPGQGTGLGLAIVRGIVADWSGEMEITSRPGAGTSVAIYLPVALGPGAGSGP